MVARADDPLNGMQVPKIDHIRYLERELKKLNVPSNEDITALLTEYGTYIQDFRLWKLGESSIEITISSKESLNLLKKYGNELVYFDGTHSVTKDGY